MTDIPTKSKSSSATSLIALLYVARGLRGFGDGFAIIILPAYMTLLGYDAVAVGMVATASLLGTALLTLIVGLIAPRHDLRPLLMFGAALMALVIAFRPLKSRAGPVMLLAVGVFGAATIVFGVSRSFWLSLAALIVVGASDMVSVVIRSTLVQISTPAAMRGRVSAVNLVFVGASNELGEFESGVTAAWLGAARAVVLGGIATCGVVAIWAQAFPALRRIDRLDEIPSPE